MCNFPIKEESLQHVYACISEALGRAQLLLDESRGWKETVEIHLPDPEYQRAFGSIQYCSACKSHESFLELRFKKEHLRYAGIFDEINAVRDNPYRNDAKSKNPEAIRFHFYTMDDPACNFIKELGDVLAVALAKA